MYISLIFEYFNISFAFSDSNKQELAATSRSHANCDCWNILLNEEKKTCQSEVFCSIEETLNYVTEKLKKTDEQRPVHVLCTGSIHLIGGVFAILDPDICER